MIEFLEKQERQLQELEDHIAGREKKPEPDPKTREEDQFIEMMKTINSSTATDRVYGEGDEDEFIKAMKDINR